MIRRGFTLIELLVVIAIIGVLSSVVLASLNTARSKGNDAGIRDNMATIATQAALYYDENSNSYGTATNDCEATGSMFENATIASAIDAIGGLNTDEVNCNADGQNYSVSAARPAGQASSHWCIDSTGLKCGITGHASSTSCGTCTSQN